VEGDGDLGLLRSSLHLQPWALVLTGMGKKVRVSVESPLPQP
jgi:hypothetical protein